MVTDIAAAVTYNTEKEKFLALKRAEERDVNPGKWDFPSGKIERNEKPREAALRELEEETKLKGEIIRKGKSFTAKTEDGNFRVHPFLTKVEDKRPETSREHSQYKWVKPEDLEKLETVKGLQKDLQNVGIDV
ncbi:MAG: NUDIX domain-containing protein [Candidatus Nanohalobium sp.]